MLEHGAIPNREPLIRVGIVLPEDQQTSLVIHFPNPSRYEIQNLSIIQPPSSLDLATQNDQVRIHNEAIPELIINRLSHAGRIDTSLILDSVIAGRGFHWKKHIQVSLPGNLSVKSIDGNLLVVNEMPLEDYLMCVATSEMSAACPSTYIEAQTVVARSWMLANVEQKHVHLGFDVCNDDCCQRYQGNSNLTHHSIEGALNTRGHIISYEGEICDARYSKSCGGMMETYQTIWDNRPHPYLQNRFDMPSKAIWDDLPLSSESNARKWIMSSPPAYCSPEWTPEESLIQYLGNVDEQGTYFRWELNVHQKDFTELLNVKCHLEAEQIDALEYLSRGGSGRLNQLRIHYRNREGHKHSFDLKSEYEIRQSLHDSFLYSSAFFVETKTDKTGTPEIFTFRGAGWGHGVGLCQIGALGMALAGKNVETILDHYYPGTKLEKIYD